MGDLSTQLTVWAGAAWGLLGGVCVEALWLYSQIRTVQEWSWRRPIPQGLTAYLISVFVRVGVGAGVAAAATGSGQVSGSLAAFGLGVAAPLVLEKLSQTVLVTSPLSPSPAQPGGRKAFANAADSSPGHAAAAPATVLDPVRVFDEETDDAG